MLDIRPIDATIAVAPQIAPEDIAAIKAAGFVAIVNNRPDGEEAGQPDGDAIRTAAEDAGLAYTAIPITQAGFSQPQVTAMIDALEKAGGPVLAFCRSGTRSCNLWALAQAKLGADADEVTAKGEGAGYGLANLRPLMDAVARQG
ncbi:MULTISPECIES: TIGR01244 family sulfur transferase [unclassified Sphingomonas]|uniref:TIGR01244 family sulfur transferase n=1 Tax=unclassified Sphingomonas TaxID=196159 RepID=UPI00092BD300|nr:MULTISPECIES: TIGR01244 family sulfur transferase [unclassified Sphingomonas]MBN8848907.1 TIGR01244 family phosphatase [Sphingomonas sp.]MBS0283179.1 TIGR01244 family phosphatase [Pseudomonadota bacterium]OJV34377.1 MAG: TIGR01244 family protein [Sphingomonas sp. 67-36]